MFDGLMGAIGDILSTGMNNAANRRMQEDAQEFTSEQAGIQRDWTEERMDDAMAYNSAEAVAGRRWSAGQAQKQRSFQERMASTSYQRAVGDLDAAGLNPMLAYMKGGAATPGGSMPSGGTASVGTPSGASASSPGMARMEKFNMAGAAIATAKGLQEVRNLKAGEDLTKAQTSEVASKEIQNLSSAKQADATVTEISQRITNMQEQVAEIREHVKESRTRQSLNAASEALTEMKTEVAAGEIPLNIARTRLTNMDLKLKSLEVPKATAWAKGYEAINSLDDENRESTERQMQGARELHKAYGPTVQKHWNSARRAASELYEGAKQWWKAQ